MKAWTKDGKVFFLPLPGAVPVVETDVIEETDGPLAADEERGAVKSVKVEGGKVRVVYNRRAKKGKSKAKDLVKAVKDAKNIAQLSKATADWMEAMNE